MMLEALSRVDSLSARRPAGWRRMVAKQRNPNPNGPSVCLASKCQIKYASLNGTPLFGHSLCVDLMPGRRRSREMTSATLLESRGRTAGRKSNRKFKKPLIIQEGTSHCKDTGAAGSVAAMLG